MGPPGEVADALLDPAARRRDVRTADADVVVAKERCCQIPQPVRIRISVIVHVGDDLSGGRLQSGIASATQARIRRSNQAERILRGDVSAMIGRAIVHNNHFKIGIIQPLQVFEAPSQGAPAVVCAYDD